jgi:hypothetical protein
MDTGGGNPMSKWSDQIELREESGEVRALRVSDGSRISIPKFPKPTADMNEWLYGLSLDALEAARQYYQDHWTWEDDATRYRLLVDRIASHINMRVVSLKSPLQQGRTTLDLTRIAQQQDRTNG